MISVFFYPPDGFRQARCTAVATRPSQHLLRAGLEFKRHIGQRHTRQRTATQTHRRRRDLFRGSPRQNTHANPRDSSRKLMSTSVHRAEPTDEGVREEQESCLLSSSFAQMGSCTSVTSERLKKSSSVGNSFQMQPEACAGDRRAALSTPV